MKDRTTQILLAAIAILLLAHLARPASSISSAQAPQVEKVPAVVEFDVPRRRQPREREIDLAWNVSRCDRRFERVLPQVAHETAERALAIR